MVSKLKVCLTHDIDRLKKTYQYLTHDLRKGKLSGFKSIFTGPEPYWQLENMAELETRYGVKSTIFFLHETIPFEPLNPKNWKLSAGRYSIEAPHIKRIIRWLDENGWEIGLHGSFLSYKDESLLRQEKDILEQVLGHEIQGIRQHYLNLTEPDTWQLQKRAGFKYDASLGRTDGIGYLDDRQKPFIQKDTGMAIIPLTLMECYLFAEAGNSKKKALQLALSWMDHAIENELVYTILWHQRMFNETDFPGYRWVYEEIIKEAQSRNAAFITCGEIAKELTLENKPDRS